MVCDETAGHTVDSLRMAVREAFLEKGMHELGVRVR
jgi:hypothetical protein